MQGVGERWQMERETEGEGGGKSLIPQKPQSPNQVQLTYPETGVAVYDGIHGGTLPARLHSPVFSEP